MSDYLQPQDVLNYLPENQEDVLYYDDALSGTNSDWVQDDIDCAEGDIASYIGAYYQLPATEVDNPISFNALKCITMSITVYKAYLRTACGMPEEVLFAYQDAMKKLREYRDEKATLPDLPLQEETGLGKTVLFSQTPIMSASRIGTFY